VTDKIYNLSIPPAGRVIIEMVRHGLPSHLSAWVSDELILGMLIVIGANALADNPERVMSSVLEMIEQPQQTKH
jgi:hypothetical protein